MNDTQGPYAVEQRLRHALHSVAATLTEDAFATTAQPAAQPTAQPTAIRKPHRKRRIALAVGAITLIPAGFVAAAVAHQGSEYVTPIPAERIVMQGSVDGSHYSLIKTNRTDACGNPVTGVELVEDRDNQPGGEWNTTGYEYGREPQGPPWCGYDRAPYLKNPALFNVGGAEVGDSFVWVYAVHPDVDTVHITSDGYIKDLKVYEVDGAGYAAFEMPNGMDDYTSELLIDGHVVPGSKATHHVRWP